tara:strand:- start:79 stop:633 length:555 start_codon:yes stop_codon:yes gene_type:complete
MALSMINSVTNFEASKPFVTKVSDVFSLNAGSDNPTGDPDTSIAAADWEAGTGATLAYNGGWCTIASDGTGNRYATLEISVTPNSTYQYDTILTATTDLSTSATAGSNTGFLIGTEKNDGTYVNQINATSGTFTGTFTVGNTIDTIYITIKSIDASRIGWFADIHLWEPGLISSKLATSRVVIE